jgi:hypothetical protein
MPTLRRLSLSSDKSAGKAYLIPHPFAKPIHIKYIDIDKFGMAVALARLKCLCIRIHL